MNKVTMFILALLCLAYTTKGLSESIDDPNLSGYYKEIPDKPNTPHYYKYEINASDDEINALLNRGIPILTDEQNIATVAIVPGELVPEFLDAFPNAEQVTGIKGTTASITIPAHDSVYIWNWWNVYNPYAGNETMHVGSESFGNSRGLVEFYIPSDILDGACITAAQMQLYCLTKSSASNYTFNLTALPTSTTCNGVAWCLYDAVGSGTQLVTSYVAGRSAGWTTINILNLEPLRSPIPAFRTFGLMADNYSAAIFASYYSVLSPTLVITYHTISSPPTNVTATKGTYTNKINISWTRPSDAVGSVYYAVYRNTVADSGTASPIIYTTDTSYNDSSSLSPCKYYYYWVKAEDDCGGFSPFSDWDAGYVMLSLSPPTGVSATKGTYTDRVCISFVENPTAEYYEIWRNTTNNSSTAAKLGSCNASPAWDLVTLIPGVTYYYWVKSGRGLCGTSGFSNSDSGWAQPPTPTPTRTPTRTPTPTYTPTRTPTRTPTSPPPPTYTPTRTPTPPLTPTSTMTPTKTPTGLAWSDGFETYTSGEFPPTWTKDGNADDSAHNYVDASKAYNGAKSLRLYGVMGGCWGALAYRPLTISPPFCVELCINTGSENLNGCHPERAVVGLREGTYWGNPGRRFLTFTNSGEIRASDDLVLGIYSTGVWYKAKIGYEVIGSTVRLTYWINGVYKGQKELAAISHEASLDNLDLGAGEGSVWYDDVVLQTGAPDTPIPTATPTSTPTREPSPVPPESTNTPMPTLTITPTSPNYIELTGSPAGKGKVALSYSCDFGLYDYYGIPLNVYLAVASGSVSPGPCSVKAFLSARDVYIYDRTLTAHKYGGRVGAPTWSNVSFPPVPTSGQVKLTLPKGLEGQAYFGVAMIRRDTGAFVRDDGYPIEVSPVTSSSARQVTAKE